MKFYTSYFYMIRFFTPDIIPISTARFDPKWYHEGKRNDHGFYDKNHVLNGLRMEALAPSLRISSECGGHDCTKSPDSCEFIKEYRKQIEALNIDDVIKVLTRYAKSYCLINRIKKEPSVAFIFHEAPDNPCSERWVIQQWFRDHGIKIEEYQKG